MRRWRRVHDITALHWSIATRIVVRRRLLGVRLRSVLLLLHHRLRVLRLRHDRTIDIGLLRRVLLRILHHVLLRRHHVLLLLRVLLSLRLRVVSNLGDLRLRIRLRLHSCSRCSCSSRGRLHHSSCSDRSSRPSHTAARDHTSYKRSMFGQRCVCTPI